jgi:hypothetical protein
MVRAIHRAQDEFLAVFEHHRRVHRVFVVRVMPAGAVEVQVRDFGRAHMLVARLEFLVQNKLFQHAADGRAFRQQHRQSAAHFRRDQKQPQLASQLAVVAPLCLLQTVQVVVQLLLGEKRRAVDAREHLVAFVAAPIRACQREQLEVLYLARVLEVRTAT